MKAIAPTRVILTGALFLGCCAVFAGNLRAEDEIELLNGARIKGQVVQESAKFITISCQGAQMDFALDKVHAVSVDDKRRVINEKTAKAPAPAPVAKPVAPAAPALPPKPIAQPAQPASPASAGNGNTRSRAEVEALIQKEGAAPPPWWDGVQLNYPQSLDLTMGKPAKGVPWDANKWVGQYFWSVINENPAKWKEGCKFAVHLMGVNKSDTSKVNEAMGQLAHIYQDCMNEYARAAYLRVKRGDAVSQDLAQCYYMLGNKDMAREVLQKYGADNTGNGSIIKLWADLGDYDVAIKLAEQKAPSNPSMAYLMAGDACRMAGRFKEALAYYDKSLKNAGNKKQIATRAQTALDAIKVYDMLDLKRIADGTYTSNCQGYSSVVTVNVTVSGGKITDSKVTDHQEKQYYGSLTETPARIVAKQGVRGVDTFSSATITSEAIINAAAKALASGVK